MITITTGTVKVMRSYDYCHFELSLSAEPKMLSEMDELRKCAARLVDKAVAQYQQARAHESQRLGLPGFRANLMAEVERIKLLPEDQWNPEQKAKVKTLADMAYWKKREALYDYEDDCEYDHDEESSSSTDSKQSRISSAGHGLTEKTK